MMHIQRIVQKKHFLLDSAHIKEVLDDLSMQDERQTLKGRRWCCAICRAYITNESNAIAVNGEHRHFKINPQGHSFEFLCFKNAEGCKREGESTAEYSWFESYSWQFAHCVSCNSQLGWFFSGPQPFYGLIKQQIILCSR